MRSARFHTVESSSSVLAITKETRSRWPVVSHCHPKPSGLWRRSTSTRPNSGAPGILAESVSPTGEAESIGWAGERAPPQPDTTTERVAMPTRARRRPTRRACGNSWTSRCTRRCRTTGRCRARCIGSTSRRTGRSSPRWGATGRHRGRRGAMPEANSASRSVLRRGADEGYEPWADQLHLPFVLVEDSRRDARSALTRGYRKCGAVPHFSLVRFGQ